MFATRSILFQLLTGVALTLSMACSDDDTESPTPTRSATQRPPIERTATPGAAHADEGTIEGFLGYPASGLPLDLEVCVEIPNTNEIVACTAERRFDESEKRLAYSVVVPAGEYFVYETTRGRRGYYTPFAACALEPGCDRSHEPTVVVVSEGETVSRIDPIDWYGP